MDLDLYYLSKISRNLRKKVQYFIILNDLLPILDNTFFIGHENVQV